MISTDLEEKESHLTNKKAFSNFLVSKTLKVLGFVVPIVYFLAKPPILSATDIV
jgi:hypothetical protein